jgi:hypothetical protein
MFKRGPAGFVAGFATAAVLFGGTAFALDVYQKQISVTYLPLKYYVDGVEKVPPADQRGFVYENRTYVPLRFLTESLGKKVQYDPQTTTIFMGARPGALPELWRETRKQGDAAFKLQYFEEGAQTVTGQEMARSVVISAVGVAPAEGEANPNASSEMWVEFPVPAGSKTISGTLYVPSTYFGQQGERKIGRLTVMNEHNQPLFGSQELTSASSAVPFSASVETAKRLKLVVTLYQNQGLPLGDGLLQTQLGISDLQVK